MQFKYIRYDVHEKLKPLVNYRVPLFYLTECSGVIQGAVWPLFGGQSHAVHVGGGTPLSGA